jgi:hypothetical protein
VSRILIALAVATTVAGCANKYEPLPMVNADDPIWQLNPDKWSTSQNALTTPPAPPQPSLFRVGTAGH